MFTNHLLSLVLEVNRLIYGHFHSFSFMAEVTEASSFVEELTDESTSTKCVENQPCSNDCVSIQAESLTEDSKPKENDSEKSTSCPCTEGKLAPQCMTRFNRLNAFNEALTIYFRSLHATSPDAFAHAVTEYNIRMAAVASEIVTFPYFLHTLFSNVFPEWKSLQIEFFLDSMAFVDFGVDIPEFNNLFDASLLTADKHYDQSRDTKRGARETFYSLYQAAVKALADPKVNKDKSGILPIYVKTDDCFKLSMSAYLQGVKELAEKHLELTSFMPTKKLPGRMQLKTNTGEEKEFDANLLVAKTVQTMLIPVCIPRKALDLYKRNDTIMQLLQASVYTYTGCHQEVYAMVDLLAMFCNISKFKMSMIFLKNTPVFTDELVKKLAAIDAERDPLGSKSKE